MADETAASIRGSQVIGSLPRAVEELVRNSLSGGANSCVVTLAGDGDVIVKDDGHGIEPAALRSFLGTSYCSHEAHGGAHGKRGEALRSIASLCVEMKIETAVHHRAGGRKRGRTESAWMPEPNEIVRCEKVLACGVVTSFHQSSDGSASSAIIPARKRAAQDLAKALTGTTVTVRGLFYRHAVRRKFANATGEGREPSAAELAGIQHVLRVLALSHPTIAFQLRTCRRGKVAVDTAYASSLAAEAAAPSSLSSQSRALVRRLRDVYPTEFSEDGSRRKMVELSFEENKEGGTSKKNSMSFRVFGAMMCSSGDNDEDRMRHREPAIVSVNGRLATHNDRLADVVLSQARSSKPSEYYLLTTVLSLSCLHSLTASAWGKRRLLGVFFHTRILQKV